MPKDLSWIYSDEFKSITKVHATQTSRRVKERIIYVKERLLEDV